MPHVRRRPLGWAGAVALSVAALCLSASPRLGSPAASADGPTVSIDPAQASVVPGETVDVTVVIADASGLYSAYVHLTFDPTLLEVVDADGSWQGVQVFPGTFPGPSEGPGDVTTNAVDNAAGTIDYDFTLLDPAPAVSGTGVLARIRFRGKATGESAITLEQADLWDALKQGIAATSVDGLCGRDARRSGTTATDTARTHRNGCSDRDPHSYGDEDEHAHAGAHPHASPTRTPKPTATSRPSATPKDTPSPKPADGYATADRRRCGGRRREAHAGGREAALRRDRRAAVADMALVLLQRRHNPRPRHLGVHLPLLRAPKRSRAPLASVATARTTGRQLEKPTERGDRLPGSAPAGTYGRPTGETQPDRAFIQRMSRASATNRARGTR